MIFKRLTTFKNICTKKNKMFEKHPYLAIWEYYQKVGLIEPKEVLSAIDILGPVPKIVLPGCIVTHYNRFSIIELTDLTKKNYALKFLLFLLPFPNQEIDYLDIFPYSAVVFDDVTYTAVTLEYGVAALSACRIKLIWAENNTASHYKYYFSKQHTD